MPANLPPQFFELQKRLSLTKDNQEKIEILEKMLAVCPKHKGTERVQEEIKKKIAKLKKVSPKKIKREEIYFVKKEGAGQVLILGPPNSGKTSLINAICQTNLKVGDYPFTTQLPSPAMMRFENISIQMVDSPPLTKDFKPGWLKNLSGQADLILVLVDLSKDIPKEIKEIEEILKEWKIQKEKILIVGNKVDLLENGRKENLISISAKEKIGLEELKRKIFEGLGIIRVYSKEPKKEIDWGNPFILKKESRLIDFAMKINENWAKKFRGAKLYQKNSKKFQIVGRDYILQDGDVVEILLSR